MFFTTVTGYFLPLLMTVCIPFVLLFVHPEVKKAEYPVTRIEIQHHVPAPDMAASVSFPDFSPDGTLSESSPTVTLFEYSPVHAPEQTGIFFDNLIAGSGNKAPPAV